MPVCIVNGCATTSKTKPYDIMLHSFPKEKELIKRWLQQMHQDFGDLEEFAEKVFTSARGNYRMCSLHFTRDAYEKRGYSIFLKKDAIPTMFPELTTDQPLKNPMTTALTSQPHTEDAGSLTNIQPPLRQTMVGSCRQDMAPHIRIKTEHEMPSSMEPVMPAATLLPQKIETVVGLSQHEPVVASQIRVKTEDKISTFATSVMGNVHIAPPSNAQLPKQDVVEGLNQHNFAVPPPTYVKTEDATTSTIVATELPAVRSMPPTSIVPQEQEMGMCPNTTGIPLEIHIKTEDESSGGFITTEIKTVHFMPSPGQPQESTSTRPQRRKRLCAPRSIKTIGTVTGYFPGQVHKSIQFDRSMGAKHRSFQVRLRPFHNSVGIQCSLVKLPRLKTMAKCRTEMATKSEKATEDLRMMTRQTPANDESNVDPFQLSNVSTFPPVFTSSPTTNSPSEVTIQQPSLRLSPSQEDLDNFLGSSTPETSDPNSSSCLPDRNLEL